MARKLYNHQPEIINYVVNGGTNNGTKILQIATTNENKLKEFRRILSDWEIVPVSLDVDEVQSMDYLIVAKKKAKLAYEKNGFNPVMVEDTCLEIRGLNNFPGTYVNDFCSDISNRRMIVGEWLKGKDRAAVARVTLAIFDGIEARVWSGQIEGEISEELVGSNGFGWDDMFVPKGAGKTFAQMTDGEKDKYSMRVKAIQSFLKSPVKIGYGILGLPEPYAQELKRVQIKKLQDKKAINFAYSLEALGKENLTNKNLIAENYKSASYDENIYFNRFYVNKSSKSLGLILTDVDRNNVKLYDNGNPVLWQMGAERRHLALAQRVEYFLEHQNKEVLQTLEDIEKDRDKFPKRNNKRSLTIERALGIEGYLTFTRASSVKEIGYKKLSSLKNVSRTDAAMTGLYGMVGKHARSIYGVGSLPFVSGWRDVIVMGAIAHMPVFVHRNNLNAVEFKNQIDLINDSRDVLTSLNLGSKALARANANIGAAIGTNPVEDIKRAERLHKEAGVNLFRIYTINSDPRVVETAYNLRQKLGDKIEIFVGQLVDRKQCKRLIRNDIKTDGLILGHGGGRQCTSATNGMALTTLEELYNLVIDRAFNETSIILEGGIGSSIGALMVMGVDCILRNAQFASCVIEQGDIYFEHKSGKICMPYHGSASAAGMIVESSNPENVASRLKLSGRAKNVEGAPGYIYYHEKANSMAFYVDEFKHYAARTLADLGAKSIWELREILEKNNNELLRLVSTEVAVTSGAYGS